MTSITASLDMGDIEMLKMEPKCNNKSIIGVISNETYNKILELYGLKYVEKKWRYNIVLLELNLLFKQVISMNIYNSYIKYKLPNICNNKLVVEIVLNNNNKIDFISQYYISKFIKKSILISFFTTLISFNI